MCLCGEVYACVYIKSLCAYSGRQSINGGVFRRGEGEAQRRYPFAVAERPRSVHRLQFTTTKQNKNDRFPFLFLYVICIGTWADPLSLCKHAFAELRYIRTFCEQDLYVPEWRNSSVYHTVHTVCRCVFIYMCVSDVNTVK